MTVIGWKTICIALNSEPIAKQRCHAQITSRYSGIMGLRKCHGLTAKQRCLAGNANALLFLRNNSPHVPTPNLEDQETMFVRPLAIDQPGMRDSVSVAGTLPSTAHWVAEVRKPPHHGKVQSLRVNPIMDLCGSHH
ncbi:hypothetical protein CSKR_108303 [Clonorchis sinensis]|uniref:Uncharacterized protein n=1 Tax=Clonorchis sinensis TaxID=79923 RepID=A0A3R7D1E4_CLOSI|nr:hypothetical protein CSKR_108303 [Clonorchis sinensis]